MTATEDEVRRFHASMKQAMLDIFFNESDEDAEKKWLQEHTSNDLIRKRAPQLSVLGMHVLDVIHRNERIRGIDIARELKVTKGAVSKVTRKLADLGFVHKSQLPSNLKEVYFAVTPLGAELAKLHEEMHRELDRQSLELIRTYDARSLELISDFLHKLAEIKFGN